jgi:ribonuclease HI
MYNLKNGRGNPTHVMDREVDLKHWQHPADDAKIIEADDHKDQLIHAYTNGSRTRHGVGSGVALFFEAELAPQEEFKLNNRRTSNQAEQLAIYKALEAIEKVDIAEGTPRTAPIFTDSRVSIESVSDTRNHNHLIAEIRKKMTSLERANWNIKICWIKAYVGVVGNELAKAAASDSDAKIVFSRLPMCTLISKIEEETKLNWQKEWEECTKARITKEFFPKVQDRQKLKIDVTPILTAMVTGHGKTRSYLHRFKSL